MNPLGLVFAELRRQTRGSLAVSLLVALAVAFGVAVSATERALREASAKASWRFDLVVGAAGSPAQLVLCAVFLQPAPLELVGPEVLEKLRADPGVAAADPVVLGDYAGAHPVVGTTAAFATDRGRLAPVEGRAFAAPFEALVGSRVPLAIGSETGFHHGTEAEQQVSPAGHAGQFHVVGRLPPTNTAWDDAILIAYEDFARLHHQESPGAPIVVVKPRSVRDAYRLRGTWRHGATTAAFPGEVLQELHGLLGEATQFVQGLVWLSQGLVVASLLLVMVLAIDARRPSTAALRALGAPRAYVFCVTWLQGVVLAAAGAAAGLAAGAAVAAGFGRWVAGRSGLAIAPRLAMTEFAQAGGLAAMAAALCAVVALTALRGDLARELKA